MRCEEEEARAAVTPARRDRAAETVWQEAADLGTDLAAAIEAACAAGALSGLSVMVLYLVYVQGTTLEEVAERLQVSYDQARRLRRRAFRRYAIRGFSMGMPRRRTPGQGEEEERTVADRLRDSLPKDLQQVDLLIRKALEDPAVRAKVEKVLPPEARSVTGRKARASRPLGVQLSSRGKRKARGRQAPHPTT